MPSKGKGFNVAPVVAARLAGEEADPTFPQSVRARFRKRAQRYLEHPVARNVLALYGIQFAGYVLPLLTIPYLARTLHPQGFGLLLFFQSFALWASLTIEYGFNLSAAREIARNRANNDVLATLASGVLGAKVLLLSVFLLLAGTVAWSVTIFRAHPLYLVFALLQTLTFGFSPFWYFQGMEKMVPAVTVEFLCRGAAVALIFGLVANPGDGWRVLALQGVAGCGILLIQSRWMYKEIGFRWPQWKQSRCALRDGWDMFVFRGAYQIYGTANAFILGMFSPSLQVVGYFGGAERIAKPLQGLTAPLTQALYPHMSRTLAESRQKALAMARWTVAACCGTGLVLALVIASLGRSFVAIFLGPAYGPSVPVLYVFALVLPINALNSALIMQWMLPSGMEKLVGRVTLGAIAINLTAAAWLALRMGPIGMAWAILLAESCKAAALISIVLRQGQPSCEAMMSP